MTFKSINGLSPKYLAVFLASSLPVQTLLSERIRFLISRAHVIHIFASGMLCAVFDLFLKGLPIVFEMAL